MLISSSSRHKISTKNPENTFLFYIIIIKGLIWSKFHLDLHSERFTFTKDIKEKMSDVENDERLY